MCLEEAMGTRDGNMGVGVGRGACHWLLPWDWQWVSCLGLLLPNWSPFPFLMERVPTNGAWIIARNGDKGGTAMAKARTLIGSLGCCLPPFA